MFQLFLTQKFHKVQNNIGPHWQHWCFVVTRDAPKWKILAKAKQNETLGPKAEYGFCKFLLIFWISFYLNIFIFHLHFSLSFSNVSFNEQKQHLNSFHFRFSYKEYQFSGMFWNFWSFNVFMKWVEFDYKTPEATKPNKSEISPWIVE